MKERRAKRAIRVALPEDYEQLDELFDLTNADFRAADSPLATARPSGHLR